jgi:hypothetical protein
MVEIREEVEIEPQPYPKFPWWLLLVIMISYASKEQILKH